MTNVRAGDEWPEAPSDASYHDESNPIDWLEGFRGHGWSVSAVPPGPFPFITPPYPRSLYGPPGTFWTFDEAALAAHYTNLPPGVTVTAVNLALRSLGVTVGAGSLLFWRTPEFVTEPTGVPMRWIHAEIIGKIGTVEQVAHTLSFRTNPADVDQDPAAIDTFLAQIGAAWTSFIHDTSVVNVSEMLSGDLTYTEVRGAYLEQHGPATVTMVPGKTRQKKHFTYPRPDYLVPTQYWQFPQGAVKGTGGTQLPWEVACVLSLQTGLRGPRNRGRFYLGPLAPAAMSTDGMFSPAMQQVGRMFGEKFVSAINTTSGNRLHVVSRAYNTSVGVNGVAVGLVPDSQRRRRRSQQEASLGVWNPA